MMAITTRKSIMVHSLCCFDAEICLKKFSTKALPLKKSIINKSVAYCVAMDGLHFGQNMALNEARFSKIKSLSKFYIDCNQSGSVKSLMFYQPRHLDLCNFQNLYLVISQIYHMFTEKHISLSCMRCHGNGLHFQGIHKIWP